MSGLNVEELRQNFRNGREELKKKRDENLRNAIEEAFNEITSDLVEKVTAESHRTNRIIIKTWSNGDEEGVRFGASGEFNGFHIQQLLKGYFNDINKDETLLYRLKKFLNPDHESEHGFPITVYYDRDFKNHGTWHLIVFIKSEDSERRRTDASERRDEGSSRTFSQSMMRGREASGRGGFQGRGGFRGRGAFRGRGGFRNVAPRH